MNKNIKWHKHPVNKSIRSKLKQQRPFILWFTGLSGSGKSTIAGAVEGELAQRLHHTYLLDGDNVRHGLSGDLAFSKQDRNENVRRVGEVAKLMLDAGLIVLSAFISPFRKDRENVRSMFEEGEFIEVYVDISIDECEKRDAKGLYKKVRDGEIKDFTGIDSPYEVPINPEIIITNENACVEGEVDQVIEYLNARGFLKQA